MKTLFQLSEATKADQHHVTAFTRMNPPTTGHMQLIDKVHAVAKDHGADHSVVVSHSQDPKKNPLSSDQKLNDLAFVGLAFVGLALVGLALVGLALVDQRLDNPKQTNQQHTYQ